MTESEKEILEPGRVLAEYPENPAAGDVVVAVDWKMGGTNNENT